MNRVMTSGDDGFWARVRTLLGRPAEGVEPAYGRAAIAVAAGRKSRPAQRIDDALRAGWAEAAGRNVSLCVMALEMDGHAEYLGSYGAEVAQESLERLQGAVATILGEGRGRCLRTDRTGLVLVLPDMPVLMARKLASRIAVAVRHEGLPNRLSHAGQVTMSMGLAVVNPEGNFDRAVLSAASQAVKRAQKRGIGRLEVSDLRGNDSRRRRAA